LYPKLRSIFSTVGGNPKRWRLGMRIDLMRLS
jgi:hypothetical protein